MGSGVDVGEAVAVGAGGKIRLTTVCPNVADAIETENKTNAMINHCQPVAMYAWRVR